MRTRAGRARARSRSSAGEERGAAPDVARASFDGDFSSGWPSEANELRRPTPYPFSVFALDNSFPEETKEEATLECEREFRLYYTLAQAPQIKAFINLGMIMALVRLAKPALDAASGSWDSVPWLCKIGHIVENVALTALCVYVRLFGFKRSAGRTMPPSTVWWHLVYFILTMFAWLRHIQGCPVFGGVIPEQVTAGFVVFALAVSWRPPLHEVIANRVTGYLSYSAVLYISRRAKLLSHSLRFLIGVVMPIVITAVLELRARRVFAYELAMSVAVGDSQGAPGRRSRSLQGSATSSPARSRSSGELSSVDGGRRHAD